jgi:hypothetical protein
MKDGTTGFGFPKEKSTPFIKRPWRVVRRTETPAQNGKSRVTAIRIRAREPRAHVPDLVGRGSRDPTIFGATIYLT